MHIVQLYVHDKQSKLVRPHKELKGFAKFDILIGSSAQDIHLRETVTLESTLKLPSLLNKDSTLKEWLEDEKGQGIIGPIMQKMAAQMGAAMGASEGEDAMGMNMMSFLMDLPLLSIFHFQDKLLPVSPEEQVASFLKEIGR